MNFFYLITPGIKINQQLKQMVILVQRQSFADVKKHRDTLLCPPMVYR